MIPISLKDRERIILHKKNKQKNADISQWLQVSVSTITRIWSQYKSTGEYKPKPQNSGRKPLVTDATMTKVTEKIADAPDTTLLELIDQFQLGISESALSKRLKKLGYTFKKRLSFQQHSKNQKS